MTKTASHKNDWVIYSAAEEQTNNGKGYWNIQSALWVSREDATNSQMRPLAITPYRNRFARTGSGLTRSFKT